MATIVEGEASESDEEIEEGIYNEPNALNEAAVKESPTPSLSSRDSSIMVKSISDTDGVSDVSTDVQQKDKIVIRHKYKSIFQKKLVDEMLGVRGHVETIIHKSNSESIKQMRQLVKNADNLTVNLKKSTYQLQLLTNDLFRLEDQIDIVNKETPLARLRSITACNTETS